MSKKRHSANRTRKQRKKSYVQKHPQSKEGGRLTSGGRERRAENIDDNPFDYFLYCHINLLNTRRTGWIRLVSQQTSL